MLAKSMLKAMSAPERKLIRDGAFAISMVTGGIAYFNYRERIRKNFLRSEAHYRFNNILTNVTPWK